MFGDQLDRGHRIETLVNGDEIFPAMLAAIEAAQTTINFETYIYWSGRIGRTFAEALARKAREGVAVRVLVDWLGSIPFDQKLIDLMKGAGASFHHFRPLHWFTLNRINNRTHRKIVVIDGTVAFTGGVGIGDQWLGNARNPQEWRDSHYRFTGPSVHDAQAAFAQHWLEATGEQLEGPLFYPPIKADGPLGAQLTISSRPGGSPMLHHMMLAALAAARAHIRIGMAYFVPDEAVIDQLVGARRRGVEVDIIVPSDKMDVQIVRKSSRYFWGRLLDAGVRIHEYQPTMYHPKLVISDDSWTTVGSANLDDRSLRLNDEANLSVYGEPFAREQIALFERDLAVSRQITLERWRRRPLVQKATDWGASLLRAQL